MRARVPRLVSSTRAAWRVTAAYVVFAFAWILGTDLAVAWLVGGSPRVHHLQTIKGVLFVLTTGAVLFAIAHYALRRRTRIHEELLRERERYRLMVEAVADYAIFQLDAEGRIATWNPGAERITGRSAAAAIGRTLDCLCTHGSATDPQLALEMARRQGAFSAECPLVRYDGSTFWAAVHITPLRACDGTITGYVNVTRDISARKAAETALQENRARLAGIIESAMDAIITVSPERRIVVFNHAAEQMFGRAAAAMLGQPFTQLLPARLEAASAGWFGEASLRLGASEAFAGLRADGEEFPAEASIAPTAAAGGAHFTVIMRDVTNVRDAERTVRRLSARILRLQDFERRRIARELHDTTAQNLAALNMNLAHLDRAISGSDPEHARIIRETMALADLAVQEIRTISYILHPPMLDTLGLARATQDYVEGFSARSSIETSTDIDDTMARLSEEAEIALFRVLQESLGNVHRHSGASHAHVRLSVEGDAVELTISDDGHGMDAITRERLLRRATVGVGITGMTERLEQLGGALHISSSDEGTTVSAAIPLSRALRNPVQTAEDIPYSL